MGKAGLRIAKVLAAHPEGYAVDVLFLDTGAKASWVQVLSWSASTNTGAMDLPYPSPPEGAYGAKETKDRDTYAIVGFIGDAVPVVLGFLYPQVCQMLFKDMNRRIDRHASDVYSSVDGAGNVELYHPSGTFVRIGTAPEHEDLTGQDFDGKWKIEKNLDTEVHVVVSVAAGGDEKARLSISPDGAVTLTTVSTLDIAVDGDITSSAAAWNHTGPLNVDGDIHSTATITGDTDVVSGAITLKTHRTSGVQTGAGTSGAPVV